MKMKRLIAGMLAFLCIFVFVGCGKESETQYDWGIDLSVRDVTPTGLTLICTQNGGKVTGELDTGSYFVVEQKEKNSWKEVKRLEQEAEIGWDDMAYLVTMGGQTEFAVNWGWIYGALPVGEYRVGKKFMDFRGAGDLEEQLLYAEFRIDKDTPKAVKTLRIVDGAETGELVLAGKQAGEVYTQNVKDISVYLDGKEADISALQDGMMADVVFDGSVMETYPAQLSCVESISVYSLGSEQNPGGGYYDLCGLYLQVLEDLWNADAGLNDNIEHIGVDLSQAPGDLTEGENAAIAWIFGNQHSVMGFHTTYEQLIADGYLTEVTAGGEKDDSKHKLYQWDNGVLFAITGSKKESGIFSLATVQFDAQKWRGPLGAYFFEDCKAVWPQMGGWENYTIGSEAIS